MKSENDKTANRQPAKTPTGSSGTSSPPSAPALPGSDVVIDSFRFQYGFLSNFHEAPIYVDGERYRSVEHAYQAYKTLDPWSRRLIREAATPGQAKKLGQGVSLRPDWDAVKVDLMRTFVRKKFDNPFLRPLLLATGNASLVEGNTWNDTFWGVCRGVGQNWLGKILMEIREECRKEEESERSLRGEVE